MKTWISLNMTPGVGPRVATKLLESFGSPEAVFNASRRELESLRLTAETIESIIRKEFHGRADAELERVRTLGGDILILDDGNYPELLKEIADPPIVLYVRGNWQECFDAPCVAIVGSRKCSTYGENAAEMLGRDLAANGICVVSGFARGIDTAAHRGAISVKGRTLAVLGTGLDSTYPRDNVRLTSEVIDAGGAIVSQFPLGTPPLKENFPYRNRIISGLCYGSVLVEATERSGSLITARLASEQNREVLAVPGNITSRNSFGTNYLIKCGAKLVQHWQDVVSELPQDIAAKLLPPKLDESIDGINKERKEAVPADLSESGRKVWKWLKPDETIGIDELLERSGLSFGELNSTLLELEMNDRLKVLPGRLYARKI